MNPVPSVFFSYLCYLADQCNSYGRDKERPNSCWATLRGVFRQNLEIGTVLNKENDNAETHSIYNEHLCIFHRGNET